MTTTSYHPEWQTSRFNYIIKRYGADFFNGKTVLELGSYNGVIGNALQELGAVVTSVEGRDFNVDNIRKDFPNLNVIHADLDVEGWEFGEFDIIVHFGVLYHLEKFHRNNLQNCVKFSKLLLLESVVHDSFDNKVFCTFEVGDDQSLSGAAGVPTKKYVEDILDSCGAKYEMIVDHELNGGSHIYDWVSMNVDERHLFKRRFWVVTK